MANYAITQYAVEMTSTEADFFVRLTSILEKFPNVNILDHEKTDYGVRFSTETPWDQNHDFTKEVQDMFPSSTIYYYVEETITDLLYTNDTVGRYFSNRYFLDSENADEEYFSSITEAAEYISQIIGENLPANFKVLQDAIDEHSENTDIFYSLHEIELRK